MTRPHNCAPGRSWHCPRRLPVPPLETLALAAAMLALTLATCWFVSVLPEIVVVQ